MRMNKNLSENPKCPKCGAERAVKNGKVQGNQRFKCKNCNYQFTKMVLPGQHVEKKLEAVKLYCNGLSMRAIAKHLKISATSILNWVRSYAKLSYEKPKPNSESHDIVIEIDEIWHFIKSKKNKLWIWKAFCRNTKQLIDWECGGRDHKTFLKLYERLKRWSAKLFCTDSYDVYSMVIKDTKLKQSKSQTYRIEGNNGRQRHWFGRFRRRTVIVSQCVEMVELTMALFARFHVNWNSDEIVSLVS